MHVHVHAHVHVHVHVSGAAVWRWQPDGRLPRTTDLVACHVPSHRPVSKARRHPCAVAAVSGASLQTRPGVSPWLGATGIVHDLDLVRVGYRVRVRVRVID